MTRRCSVGLCTTNYDSQQERKGKRKRKKEVKKTKLKVFGFPIDREKCQQWLDALPNKIKYDDITRNMGVCQLHWPPNYATIKRKGHLLPLNPPSVFVAPKSFCKQSISKPREIETRKVSSAARSFTPSDVEVEIDPDIITDWDMLVCFCKGTFQLVIEDCDKITVMDVSGNPPIVTYSVCININFSVICYKNSTHVPVRDLVGGFSARLERLSQLHSIIGKVKNFELNFSAEILSLQQRILSLVGNGKLDELQEKQIKFLCEQLKMHSSKSATGRRFTREIMNVAINLYLKSRSCYKQLSETLLLPTAKTVKSFFGKLGSPGSIEDCKRVVSDVFSSLDRKQKFCKIIIDEIHVKPSIQYQGGHIVGYSEDHPDKPAKTILTFMVSPLLGGPAFATRLIPVHSLKHEMMMEQLLMLIQIIHDCEGFVYLVISDNLRANQALFKKLHKDYGSKSIFSINHPIPNNEFEELFLFYDPTHLMKNIRNNWVTEKMRTLQFICPGTGKTVTAKWSDIVKIYSDEKESAVKTTKLSYASVFPNSFEKQKVSLVLDVFDEKTISALTLKGFTDTATFVSYVTKMWHILNIRAPRHGEDLNDEDRKKFMSSEDDRLSFLCDMATSFKLMDNTSSPTRVKCLTSDTSNALHMTLNGITQLIKTLLDKGLTYVLTREFSSDRIEAEFGIWRQLHGGNYHISMLQVLSSAKFQKLKLYLKLKKDKNSNHVQLNNCCSEELTADELEEVDNCFSGASNLNDDEKSSLYYISGYVAFKEGIPTSEECELSLPNSEFTKLVSRGKLTHPPEELFDLSMYLYAYHKNVNKLCANKLIKGFSKVYEVCGCDYDNQTSILRRFINTFSNGFRKQQSDIIKQEQSKRSTIKRKRVSGN